MSLRLAALALLVPGVALAGFQASSVKTTSRSSGTSPYDAAAALDGNAATAWQVDPEQDNAGQWIELDVPKGKVDKVSIVVGWGESDKTWADHARLKAGRIEVYTLSGPEPKLVLEHKFTVEDVRTPQAIDLPDPEVGDELSGGRVRLVVTEVFPGKDYANLALGELLVHLAQFDVKAFTVTEATSSADGRGTDALSDKSTRTWWEAGADDATPSFTLDAGRYSVSSVGITAGPSTHARPKVVEITQGSAVRRYDLANSASVQWVELPAVIGYTGSGFGSITVQFVETWPGSKGGAPAVAEVALKAVQLELF